jgi:hypothetical protein
MADDAFPVNNLLGTAKSREVQRAMIAEMRGDRVSATLHFLAAGHMELVLAADYTAAGQTDLAIRSRVSAGSCLWRAGQAIQARTVFDAIIKEYPARAVEFQAVIAELAQDYPALAS